MPTVVEPLVSLGLVRHTRHAPVVHSFSYPALFLALPMRALDAGTCSFANRNRGWGLRFDDADHGLPHATPTGTPTGIAQGPPPPASSLTWLQALLAEHGVQAHTGGEVWLQTLPRLLGYVFKPVSFWLCTRADGSLHTVVVEVNNTFGQRQVYLLTGPHVAWGANLLASKVFHVSPFLPVQGHYRFRFHWARGRLVSRIEWWQDGACVLTTSLSGPLQAASAARLAALLWRFPLHALAVTARIHWQALRLWWLGVAFHSLPARSGDPVNVASSPLSARFANCSPAAPPFDPRNQ